ncbi:MAG TPA: helix-turn-helix domain-containing protein [Streptosporangiaceae bacterium]|nr:helix-turn-helix domain-containing protein [Streptosporangiaceae bacterium]
MEELKSPGGLTQGQRADLPVRRVTVNSIVALNMAYFRKAADLTQEELGERIGWGKSVVSTAERSSDAKRVRSFSAEDLIAISTALGVPLAALFLPPEDHGTAVRYVLDGPGHKHLEVTDLLAYVSPAYGGDSPVMDAYRKRNIAAGASMLAAVRQAGLHLAAGDGALGSLGAEEARETFASSPVPIDRTADQQIADTDDASDRTFERAASDPDTIIADARREATRIIGDAQERAAALMRDVNEVIRHRSELEERVDDLRKFERSYRTRLQVFFEGQLRELYAPEMRQQAEERIRELQEDTAGADTAQANALLLRRDGTYEVLPFDPGAGTKNTDNEGLSDHDTEE